MSNVKFDTILVFYDSKHIQRKRNKFKAFKNVRLEDAILLISRHLEL